MFISDKKAINFMGVESNAKQNLENFSKNIMEFGTGMPTSMCAADALTVINVLL